MLAQDFIQPLLADPRLDVTPCDFTFGDANSTGAELPFVQILHAIQRTEDAERFIRGDGVLRVAVNVVFVVTAGIGRSEKSPAAMHAQNAADALLAVNPVQPAENFQRGERMISVLQRGKTRRKKQSAHVAPVVNRRISRRMRESVCTAAICWMSFSRSTRSSELDFAQKTQIPDAPILNPHHVVMLCLNPRPRIAARQE